MTQYIGLDGHSKTSTFVVLDERGNLLAQRHVPTTEKHLLGFIASLKPGKKKLIYEESHIARWFHCLFEGKVDEQVACDPFYLGKKQGPKDDDRDAWHLANEGRCGHVVPVFHEANDLAEIRALMGAYSDLVREITRTKNRFKALFLAEALESGGDAIYRDSKRIEELSLATNRFVGHQLFTQLEELEKIKKEYEAILTKGKKKNPLIKKLATIPGFGPVRSHTVAALICSGHRFPNKHKFWAYSMLVRYKQISNDKCYGVKAVRGRRELKATFDGAAESVLRGSSSLRSYYDQLRAKGLEHKKAKKAVARKIAAICLSIMKNGTEFDDHFEQKQRRLSKQKKSV